VHRLTLLRAKLTFFAVTARNNDLLAIGAPSHINSPFIRAFAAFGGGWLA
jgi:hypothetical protein